MNENQELSSEGQPNSYSSQGRLEDFFSSLKHFGLRAKQELKRAERYCEYLSCLSITVTSEGKISQGSEILDYGNREEMLEGLRRVVRNSIRETDISSGFEDNRMALLLVETPRKGASSLSKRLQENIQNFLLANVASEESWKVSFTILSFPDTVNTKEDFLAHLEDLAAGRQALVS